MATDLPWRLICSGFQSGSANMALDEALLESVAAGRSGPVLRLYRWAPHTVTLGYAQPLSRAVNLAACQKLGIDVVRRCTGGRAVLHGEEVTYAVIAAEGGAIFPADILGSYRVIAEVLQAALSSLGMTVELASGRDRNSGEVSHPSACFVAPSSYELVYHGCKLTGSAQKRTGSAFLQHGSIPVELDPLLLSRTLNPDDCDHAAVAAQFKRKIGWLNRWLPQPTSVDAVENLLIAAFRDGIAANLQPDQPTAHELKRMTELSAARYAKILAAPASASI